MSQQVPSRSRLRVPAFLRGYSPMQLTIAGVLAAAVVIGTFFVVRAVSAPTYAVLFTNLEAADAATVVDTLKTQGVPYELQSGGTAILVPSEQVDSLRLSLAAEGLPESSTVGYELLDSQSLTTSSFREEINYQRALEGELARTLQSVDGVSAASVRLVMPQERLFSNDSRPASAAVQLTTSGTLTSDQVTAVTNLVASSVPDLNPDMVTVTDSTGRLLTGGEMGAAGMASDKVQSQVEARLIASADSMLAQVLGPDKAVVRVAADISRDNSTQQSEVFDPDRQAVGSQTTSTEEYTSNSNSVTNQELTGAPDPVANAQAANQDTQDSTTTYNSEATATENLVSRTITETSTPPGEVARLTVAVAVSDDVTATTQQITDLVSNAVGLNTDRGDTIVVTAMPFVETKTLEPTPADVPVMGGNLPTLLGAALLVIIALFLLFRLRPRKTPLSPYELAALSGEGAAQSSDPQRPPRTAADKLFEQIDASPEEAAGVLRGWLAEDATKGR